MNNTKTFFVISPELNPVDNTYIYFGKKFKLQTELISEINNFFNSINIKKIETEINEIAETILSGKTYIFENRYWFFTV